VKLSGTALASFLRKPDPATRAVLFYGPDGGLVRERADAVARSVCPDLRDPFRVAELTPALLAQDPARLADEIGAMSLTGGRRVIRIRDAGDAIAKLLGEQLAASGARDRGADCIVVCEAGDLPPRSALRKLFEAANRDVASVPCYADGPRELETLVRETLAADKIAIAPDAVAYLVGHLGSDRLMTRNELERLALYLGPGARAGLDDVIACVGDTAALSLDDAVLAAADGDVAGFERALARFFQEGESPVTVLRAAIRHMQRLHLAGAQAGGGGMSVADAVKALRPPVFFKHVDRFVAQVGLWPPARAAAALVLLTEAELNAKRTGLPAETMCRDALLSLARQARERRRGAPGTGPVRRAAGPA
jgi:DNA polymerase III subunit delta